MIPTTKKPIIRVTNCPWEYVDEHGETKKETAVIEYKSRTVKELREFEKLSIEQPDKIIYLSDRVLWRVHRLPNLVEGEVTIDWLDEQEPVNLKAILEAIADDENPEKKSDTAT